MYSLNDVLIFDDGKFGRDVVKEKAEFIGLRKGGVEKVFIEDGGTGYQVEILLYLITQVQTVMEGRACYRCNRRCCNLRKQN